MQRSKQHIDRLNRLKLKVGLKTAKPIAIITLPTEHLTFCEEETKIFIPPKARAVPPEIRAAALFQEKKPSQVDETLLASMDEQKTPWAAKLLAYSSFLEHHDIKSAHAILTPLKTLYLSGVYRNQILAASKRLENKLRKSSKDTVIFPGPMSTTDEDLLKKLSDEFEEKISYRINQLNQCFPLNQTKFKEYLYSIATLEFCKNKHYCPHITEETTIRPSIASIALHTAQCEYEVYNEFRTIESCQASIVAFLEVLSLYDGIIPDVFPVMDYADIALSGALHHLSQSTSETKRAREKIESAIQLLSFNVTTSLRQKQLLKLAFMLKDILSKPIEMRRQFAISLLKPLSFEELRLKKRELFELHQKKITAYKEELHTGFNFIFEFLQNNDFSGAIQDAAHFAMRDNLGVDILIDLLKITYQFHLARKATLTKKESAPKIPPTPLVKDSKEIAREVEDKEVEYKAVSEETKQQRAQDDAKKIALKKELNQKNKDKKKRKKINRQLRKEIQTDPTPSETKLPLSPRTPLASPKEVKTDLHVFLKERGDFQQINLLLDFFKMIESAGGTIWIKGTSVSSLVTGFPSLPTDLDIAFQGINQDKLPALFETAKEFKLTESIGHLTYRSLQFNLGSILCQMTFEQSRYYTKDFIPLTSQYIALNSAGKIVVSETVQAFYEQEGHLYRIEPPYPNARCYLMRTLKHDVTYVELSSFKRDASVTDTLYCLGWLQAFFQMRFNTHFFEEEIQKVIEWAQQSLHKQLHSCDQIKEKTILILKACVIVIFSEFCHRLPDTNPTNILLKKHFFDLTFVELMTENLFAKLILTQKKATHSFASSLILALVEFPTFAHFGNKGKVFFDKHFFIPLINILTQPDPRAVHPFFAGCSLSGGFVKHTAAPSYTP